METFGIRKSDAPFFLPPYEWYNAEIVKWTREAGLTLVNFSPGTRSTADYTYPEMAERYVPSDEIYRSIMAKEASSPEGLNGFILLVHIGTDSRRTDKFYNRLEELIQDLKGKGYRFTHLKALLQ
jgi:peptidoglycan/xylan/chitin deacetylase (PgdA/CDA1 family)